MRQTISRWFWLWSLSAAHLFYRWKGRDMMKMWKIVSESPVKVAIPDLGIYLEPNTSVEVLEDRAVWSKDLQEALMLRKVRKEFVQLPVEAPLVLPAKPRPPVPAGPSMPLPMEVAMTKALEKNNDLLQSIVDLLKTQQVVSVPVSNYLHPQPAMVSENPIHFVEDKPSVFIPKIEKEQVEFGGEVAGATTVSNSEKSASASKKLRELRNKK